MTKHSEYPSVCIIILNWNGWKDTLECLNSVINLAYPRLRVVLIDNGSTDNSLEMIRYWLKKHKQTYNPPTPHGSDHISLPFIEYHVREATLGGDLRMEDSVFGDRTKYEIVIIKSIENQGFARGNNIGIKYAIIQNFDYIFLLNNDTIIEKDTLTALVTYMEKNCHIGVATPQIHYYEEPCRISNAGGYLTITGHRRYFSHNKIYKKNDQHLVKNITFVTGCALLAHMYIFTKYGLLSEDYFFGEEDYEFSLRMKEKRIQMVCVTDGKVYHKIGQSSKRLLVQIDSLFIYYLNRLINLKKVYPNGYWEIWRYGVLIYILPLLFFKFHFRPRILFKFARNLLKYSRLYNGVPRNILEDIKKRRINLE